MMSKGREKPTKIVTCESWFSTEKLSGRLQVTRRLNSYWWETMMFFAPYERNEKFPQIHCAKKEVSLAMIDVRVVFIYKRGKKENVFCRSIAFSFLKMVSKR